MKIGKPKRFASFKPILTSSTIPSEPGITGHLTLFAVAFARDLSPSRVIVSAEGPMKFTPQLLQIEAKLAFSLKNPYPGWSASAPVISQAERILEILRYDF